jgi:hypothetical protein
MRQELGEPVGRRDRMDRVARPVEDQHRHVDPRDERGVRKVGCGRAAQHAGEADGVAGSDHPFVRVEPTAGISERSGERSRPGGLHELVDGPSFHERGTELVHLALRRAGLPCGRRDHEHQRLDPFGREDRRVQRGRAAHRRATRHVLADPERICERELVLGERTPVVRRGVGGGSRRTVTAGVVPHDVEPASRRRPVDERQLVLAGHRAGQTMTPHERRPRSAALVLQRDPADLRRTRHGRVARH